MMKTIYKIILLTFLSTGLFAGSVATVTALKGTASIFREGAKSEALLGAELLAKDNITTADNSKLQMIFSDETIVTLGKNSNFSIEEYLFENTEEPVVEFGMIKGAMRTITGKIGKLAPQKFKVKTKTATIGIRGTNFSIIIEEDGTFEAYCTYGAISITVNGKEYRVEQGYFIHISPEGEVEIKAFSSKDLKKMKQLYFSFAKPKDGGISKEKYVQDSSNEEQLDVTIDDDSGIIIQDIAESNMDNIQLNTDSLSDILAGYSMADAYYTGTSTFEDASVGTASLLIDFGADTASLSITDLFSNETVFATNPTFNGSTFNASQTTPPAGGFQNEGSASGVFQGPTGNEVKGNFAIDDGYGSFSTGTYDVSTSQTLK